MELELLNNNLSSYDTRDLRNLVDHDHKQVSISRQCALLGLPRSLQCQPPEVAYLRCAVPPGCSAEQLGELLLR